MTALDTDDLAVVTGPLRLAKGNGRVYLTPLETVRVVRTADVDGDALVSGLESGKLQYVDASSLTALEDLAQDYVWAGDYEGDE